MNNTHRRRTTDTPRLRGKVVISTSGRFIKMRKNQRRIRCSRHARGERV